jgi:hypothetical protein
MAQVPDTSAANAATIPEVSNTTQANAVLRMASPIAALQGQG